MKTVLELIADYREMLRAIGAMEDDMASVPAVGVRALLDDIEAAVREDWWSEPAPKNGVAK